MSRPILERRLNFQRYHDSKADVKECNTICCVFEFLSGRRSAVTIAFCLFDSAIGSKTLDFWFEWKKVVEILSME
ncbi:hypothetical protein [Algoriphagus resistens]|uniref:hypothetical protein n=1 Tax=Algoriphagus resistens TaxID=1750590 RepID=UPI000716A747|nr:hypothetical protein [Algoriphagus resistens]